MYRIILAVDQIHPEAGGNVPNFSVSKQDGSYSKDRLNCSEFIWEEAGNGQNSSEREVLAGHSRAQIYFKYGIPRTFVSVLRTEKGPNDHSLASEAESLRECPISSMPGVRRKLSFATVPRGARSSGASVMTPAWWWWWWW